MRPSLHFAAAFLLLAACGEERPKGGEDAGTHGMGTKEVSANKPFMEHPTGDHTSAKDAIISAMERLATLRGESPWITFSGQGQESHEDAYHIEEVKVLGRTIEMDRAAIDIDPVLRAAGLTREQTGLTVDGRKISLPRASARQMGEFRDALFRIGLGIRPFEGETDYAVGAEW